MSTAKGDLRLVVYLSEKSFFSKGHLSSSLPFFTRADSSFRQLNPAFENIVQGEPSCLTATGVEKYA